MKYNLILGYQLFEKNLGFPTVRVFINDVLIDEFVCDNENSSKIKTVYDENLTTANETYTKIHRIKQTFTFSTPSKLKIYEIDSSTLSDKGSLKIQVVNNNSDYNNGFMNKRALAMISPVFLLPKWLVDDEVTMGRIIKKSCYLKGKTPGYWKMRSKEYLEKERVIWPGYCNYPDNRYEVGQEDLLVSGGKFDVIFKIKKKHGIYFITKDEELPIGFFHTDDFFHAFYQWKNNYQFYIYGERKYDHTNTSSISNEMNNDMNNVRPVELVKVNNINTDNED